MLWLVGCGSCDRRSDAPAEAAAASEPKPVPRAIPVGTIEGEIRLAEGAELPKYSRAALGESPRVTRPEICPAPRDTELTPVRRTEAGRLSGVLVSVTGFAKSPNSEPREHELRIFDCGLEPRIIAATRGDRLKIVNETPHAFLPSFGNEPFTDALAHKQVRTVALDRGGVIPVRCTFGSGCGRSDVFVLYHPVHSVTDAEGRFRMENVPAGSVKVHAWHPLFDEAAAEVTIASGETKRVELTLRPAKIAPEAPPANGTEAEPRDESAAPEEPSSPAE